MKAKNPNKQKGSLILEYALISLFTLTLTIGILAYLQNVFQDKFETLAKDFGLDEDLFKISLFKED